MLYITGRSWVSKINPAQLGPALVDAARAGELGEMKIFLLQGVNPNHTHPHHGTALLQAVINGHHHCVDHLLEKGASVTHENFHGLCALDIAVQHNDLNTIKTFVKHKVDLDHHGRGADSALRTVARRGHLPMLNMLLQGEASPDKVKSPKGPTALLIAISHGNFECAKSLVQHGANIHCRSEEHGNISALALAAARGQCKFLFDAGPWNLEVQDMKGQTPLFYAIANGNGNNPGAIKLLLEHGAKTQLGKKTALDCARKHEFRDIVLVLEQHDRAMRPSPPQNIQQRPPPPQTHSRGTPHRPLLQQNGQQRPPQQQTYGRGTSNGALSQHNIQQRPAPPQTHGRGTPHRPLIQQHIQHRSAPEQTYGRGGPSRPPPPRNSHSTNSNIRRRDRSVSESISSESSDDCSMSSFQEPRRAYQPRRERYEEEPEHTLKPKKSFWHKVFD